MNLESVVNEEFIKGVCCLQVFSWRQLGWAQLTNLKLAFPETVEPSRDRAGYPQNININLPHLASWPVAFSTLAHIQHTPLYTAPNSHIYIYSLPDRVATHQSLPTPKRTTVNAVSESSFLWFPYKGRQQSRTRLSRSIYSRSSTLSLPSEPPPVPLSPQGRSRDSLDFSLPSRDTQSRSSPSGTQKPFVESWGELERNP